MYYLQRDSLLDIQVPFTEILVHDRSGVFDTNARVLTDVLGTQAQPASTDYVQCVIEAVEELVASKSKLALMLSGGVDSVFLYNEISKRVNTSDLAIVTTPLLALSSPFLFEEVVHRHEMFFADKGNNILKDVMVAGWHVVTGCGCDTVLYDGSVIQYADTSLDEMKAGMAESTMSEVSEYDTIQTQLSEILGLSISNPLEYRRAFNTVFIWQVQEVMAGTLAGYGIPGEHFSNPFLDRRIHDWLYAVWGTDYSQHIDKKCMREYVQDSCPWMLSEPLDTDVIHTEMNSWFSGNKPLINQVSDTWEYSYS